MEEQPSQWSLVSNTIKDVDCPNDLLLQAARTGNIHLAKGLLDASVNGKVDLNVNCKGLQKGNLGWSPLHLASYFGHTSLATLLLNHDADVNIVNNEGDTPLHKASYTGREEVVVLLLSNDANVFIKNGFGQTPKEIAKNDRIQNLLQAAEEADCKKKETVFLAAVKDGDVVTVKELLNDPIFKNINCTDSSGNTALHAAAYRGRQEIAILLLQVGIDSAIRNDKGQLAADLASSPQMKQILSVKPIKRLFNVASHFEGAILRKSRIFGWKPVWAVLERGTLSFFKSRADAATGRQRKGYKYLDSAKVQPDNCESANFTINFSDNTTQMFSIPSIHTRAIDREKWLSALEEHIEYSTHYLQQGMGIMADSDEEEHNKVLPLSTMQDALKSALAHQRLLENQIETVASNFEDFATIESGTGSNQLWNMALQLKDIIEHSRIMSSSLSHCMALFSQQEEVRKLQLKQERERCRVLEDALHALAREHHVLECSLSATYKSPPRSPCHLDETDEFYDAFDGEDMLDDDNDALLSYGSEIEAETTVSAEKQPDFYLTCKEVALSQSNEVSSIWGRTKLPVPMFSKDEFSMWSILKQCIGKELSKITMPVVFNEPLSLLQRIAEYMEYCDLLTKANLATDPIERMQLVAAFATSASASNWERIGKPFNPLLGETYELVREESGFRLVCEQVSHHPPISAFHAQSKNFVFYGSVYPKLKFWGKSIEVIPEGLVTVELPSHKEVYTWNNVTCCIHNIIVGKLWLEQYGVMEVVCHQNNLKAVLNFKPAGWFGRDLHRIEGFIYDKQKKKHRFLYGKWTDYMKCADPSDAEEYFKTHKNKAQAQPAPAKSESATPTGSPAHTSSSRKVVSKLNNFTRQLTGGGSQSVDSAIGPPNLDLEGSEIPKSDSAFSLDIPNSESIWVAIPRPEYSPEYYHFTIFAMALNEFKPGMEQYLPRTDSRLRPDIRKLEEGDLAGAAFEKNRLEEKQREVRKQRKKGKESWEPLWFHLGKHAHAKEEVWLFRGSYWKRDYSKCEDIF